MKPLVVAFLIVILSLALCRAQSTRYDDRIFNSVTVNEDVVYADAPQLNSPFLDESNTTNVDLIMDIHRPVGDTSTSRRVIIFVHGGAFVSGNKDHDDMKAFCDTFALKGYVTATINYRLGMNTADDKSCTRAVYRGLQDGRAAVRFLRANAATYGIDPGKVYMAGSSAGGFIALHSIYMNEESEKPEEAGAYTYYTGYPPAPVYAPDLGGFDIGDNLAYEGQPDAIMSLWGAVKDTTLITVNDTTPMFLVHGTADNIVPFDVGSPFNYPVFPPTYGSNPINTRLNTLSFSRKDTYFVLGEGHEFYGVTNGNWDDGSGGNAYWDTVVVKTTVFFANQGRATVSTSGISDIGYSYASCGGNVTDEGDNPVTAKGVCWNTSSSPGIGNSQTLDGTGTGGFVSQLTSLSKNKKYFVRAYATNTEGTAYGEEIIFFTRYDSPGSSLSFDGINDYVEIPDYDNLDLTTNYTIEVWLKPSSFASEAGIVSKYQGTGSYAYFLSLNDQSPYTGINFDGLTTDNGMLSAGTWTHIAAVNDNGTRTVYVNGIEQALSSSPVTVQATSTKLCIGRHNATNYLNGTIDDVRFWGSARSQSEIRENMHRSLTGGETGLVAYWPFNDGTGSTVLSECVSGMHGSLRNIEESTAWEDSEAIYKKWQSTGTSAWSATDNWNTTFAEPGTNDMVLITSGVTQPEITNNPDNPAKCSILKIETGASLTVNAGKALTVSDTVQNNAGNSGLLLKSDATGTGSLILNSSNVPATVERYIAAATWNDWHDGWHILSSPVASQAINPAFTVTPADEYDFYAWYEPQNTWVNFKNTTESPTWNDANGGTNFNVESGYLVSYKGTDTKQFTGVLNSNVVNITGMSISSGDNYGWHLLGNPFSSALTWDNTWTKSDIGGVINIWNEAGQSYTPLSADDGDVIPMANGFMVQVTSDPGSINIPPASRVHDSQLWYKNYDYPVIKLFAKNLDKPSLQESQVRFNPASTKGYDHEYDGRFLPGYAPQFYSVNQGESLMVNSLPEITKELIIPFHFIKNEGKNFAIVVEGMETLDATCYLVDLKLNIIHDLSINPVYSFKASQEDEPGRFILKFNSDLSDPDSHAESIILLYGRGIYLLSRSDDVSVELYNVAGHLLASRQTGSGLQLIHSITKPGIYIVRVSENSQATIRKIAIP